MNKQLDEILDFCFENKVSWIEDQLDGTSYYKESMEGIDKRKTETNHDRTILPSEAFGEGYVPEFSQASEVIQGDCLELMKDIPDGSVDLTVTSPPYDNLRSYNGNNKLWGEHVWRGVIAELYRVTKDGGVVVWVVGDATIKGSETGTSFKQALHAMDCGFNLHDTMIYQKYGSGLPHKAHRYGGAFEYMFVFSKGSPSHGVIRTFPPTGKVGKTTRRQKDGTIKRGTYNIGGGKLPNVWQYAGDTKQKHPAVFPEKLANDHITSWSNEGDIVLDPFAGSGTTGVAAQNLNRNFILMEQEPEYVEIIKKRLELNKERLTKMEAEL